MDLRQWLPTVAAVLAFGLSFGFGWKRVAAPKGRGPPGGRPKLVEAEKEKTPENNTQAGERPAAVS